ncbi:hypothetical protein Q5P01_006490 [Channa striata]|uniref:Pirin n=1 Tax=Channa striata TaxID=64152 RepID=A0AA88NBG6_CHASR|nr:hypothetical protein Q5P01_006490 [Channa striata]
MRGTSLGPSYAAVHHCYDTDSSSSAHRLTTNNRPDGDTRSPGRHSNPANKHCNGKKKRSTTTGLPLEQQLAESSISEGAVCPPLSLQVVDSYGEWAALWESQFTALNIPHLRSHTLVHTDASNKKALQEFILKHNRADELHSLPDQIYILDKNAFFNDMRLGKKERKRLNIVSTLKKSLSFSLPGTKLSVDFFKDQVERFNLDKVLMKGTVEQVIPVTEHTRENEEKNDCVRKQESDGEATEAPERKEDRAGKRVKYFEVHLQEGIILKARQVVMATGPTRVQMANIPSWVKSIEESYPEERLQHTVHLMHHQANSKPTLGETNCQIQKETFSHRVCEAGQRVMVVGGGLTSAHVISIALQQGANHVTWVMRKHLQLKQFDVGDVESLVGRYSHVEHGIKMDGQAYLRQFYNERSIHKRLAMIRQARKGGAVTPEAYIQLKKFILNGQVDVKTYCQVSEARWCYRSQAWSLSLSTGDHWTGDVIWLATGCKLDVKQDPLLSGVMKEFPLQVIDGWPCISESLQWAEGCPLYLMGQYTALQVGPHAVNLAGGQAASLRIAKHIMHHQQQNSGGASELRRERTKPEEYIQQMQVEVSALRRKQSDGHSKFIVTPSPDVGSGGVISKTLCDTMNVRKVQRTVLSVEQSEGVGARVRRSIGRKELRNLDPFLMLDEFKVSKPAGFPDHPHRGFETVTYVLEGITAHEDFCGHTGQLKPGDLQWMTAGRGVVHAEMPVSDEPVVGLQLWVNLSKRDKMVEPAYQELKGSDIPKPSQGGVTVAVISGEALGAKSKVFTRTPTLYLDFKLQAGAVHVQPVPLGWTSFIYTLSGSIYLGPDQEQQKVDPHHTVVFGDGDCVKFENKGSEVSHFVLIAGQPINEPVVQHGPFVMTSEEEITQAIRDYQTGTNGFERAKNWESKIRDSF